MRLDEGLGAAAELCLKLPKFWIHYRGKLLIKQVLECNLMENYINKVLKIYDIRLILSSLKIGP